MLKKPFPTKPEDVAKASAEFQKRENALNADAPEWGLHIRRADNDEKLYTDLTYHAMMALLLVPLGVAINHDTIMSADVYRAGVHRARLETFAQSDGKETPSHASP